MDNWTVVIPHRGGAREIALKIADSFKDMESINLSIFDTAEYTNLYTSLLKKPDPDRVAAVPSSCTNPSLPLSAAHGWVKTIAA